jgi:hypothetical protein
MNIPAIHLVLLVAATWRLSNLLANEDGPFHMFKTLRSRIARAEVRSRRKNGLLSRLHLYEGVNCEYCNSIWHGTLLTIIYRLFNPIDLTTAILLPLALSTGAIIIKHFVYITKSVDTRFDQQNQAYLEAKETLKKRLANGNGAHPVAQGTPEWDAIIFEQNLEGRR